MKLKTSLVAGAFSLCYLSPDAPRAKRQDHLDRKGSQARRARPEIRAVTQISAAEDQRRADEQRRGDEQRGADEQKRADDKTRGGHDEPCPSGEHSHTDPGTEKRVGVMRLNDLAGIFRVQGQPRKPIASAPEATCPIRLVVSMGRRNTFLKFTRRSLKHLKSFVGVDLSAALLCPDPTGNSRTGLFSSGSIVVIAPFVFSFEPRCQGLADHRSRLSHRWPL